MAAFKTKEIAFLNIYKWSFNFSKYFFSFQWSHAELLKGQTCMHQPKGKRLWERPQHHPDQLHRELLITSDREILFLYNCRFHTTQICCVLVGAVLWGGIFIQYGAMFSSVWSTHFSLGKICSGRTNTLLVKFWSLKYWMYQWIHDIYNQIA